MSRTPDVDHARDALMFAAANELIDQALPILGRIGDHDSGAQMVAIICLLEGHMKARNVTDAQLIRLLWDLRPMMTTGPGTRFEPPPTTPPKRD